MKHSLGITGLIIFIFLLAQFLGLGILVKYIDPAKSTEEGKTIFKDLPYGERPQVEERTSFIPVILAILLGTGILLLLIRYRLSLVWKLWFLIAVVLALTVAWSAFLQPWLAALLALGLGAWKIFRPNFWVHNFTEIFIYGGLAAIFSPLFTLGSVSILLVLIAAYDAYAVWKSKHMITMAQSQAKSKVFAGLVIPYRAEAGAGIKGRISYALVSKALPWLSRKMPPAADRTGVSKTAAVKAEAGKSGKTGKPVKMRTAILGGGDIGFPLIFAGVVLKELGLWQSLVIPFFAAGALLLLLLIADERKFYPAMPFISAGCFLGLGVVWLLMLAF